MVIPFYHCDVVWRRPPEEQRAIRERQYDAALEAMARFPEFRFEFDQAVTVREYLETRPEAADRLRQYLREGRLDITGGEEAIPDTNLVSGEGLVRNFFLGRLWFEETLGAQPVVANLDDAFGLTPQLPQIFARFGYRYFRDARTPGLDRALALRGILWEGLDGSRIFYLPAQAHVTENTHVCNLPVVYSPPERVQASLQEAVTLEVPVVYCTYGSEEDLVRAEVIQAILDFPSPPGVSLRFGLARECLAEAERRCPDPPVVKGEFNPSQPGTHITRITLKQAYREAEWATLASEAHSASR